jgi:Na+/melibiose symporter-like transporter
VEDSCEDDKIKAEFSALLLFEFFASLMPLTMVLLWFRESPPSPASPCSEVKHGKYSEEIRALFRNKQFLAMLFAFGTILGSFNIYGSLLDNILDCYGFSTDQVSYLAATMMVSGIVSAALFGIYIEKTLKYYLVFRVLGVLSLVACVGFPLILATAKDNFPLIFLLCTIFGVVFIPLMPLTFDYGTDVLFPAGEAQITGCLMTSGNFIGVLFVLLPLARC